LVWTETTEKRAGAKGETQGKFPNLGDPVGQGGCKTNGPAKGARRGKERDWFAKRGKGPPTRGWSSPLSPRGGKSTDHPFWIPKRGGAYKKTTPHENQGGGGEQSLDEPKK